MYKLVLECWLPVASNPRIFIVENHVHATDSHWTTLNSVQMSGTRMWCTWMIIMLNLSTSNTLCMCLCVCACMLSCLRDRISFGARWIFIIFWCHFKVNLITINTLRFLLNAGVLFSSSLLSIILCGIFFSLFSFQIRSSSNTNVCFVCRHYCLTLCGIMFGRHKLELKWAHGRI